MLPERFAVENQVIEPDLIQKILYPYSSKGTDYLSSTKIIYSCLTDQNSGQSPLLVVAGRFYIPSSCYITDTGHFNAVEYLICFNQLAYSTFGYMVNSGFFRDNDIKSISTQCQQALAQVTMGRYFDNQLSSMFILKTRTRFKKVIDARDFTGECSFNKIFLKKDTVFFETSCVFTDDHEGYADGDVLLAYPLNFRNHT